MELLELEYLVNKEKKTKYDWIRIRELRSRFWGEIGPGRPQRTYHVIYEDGVELMIESQKVLVETTGVYRGKLMKAINTGQLLVSEIEDREFRLFFAD